MGRVEEMASRGVEVWIGLGSNLNEPAHQLELALAVLQQLAMEDSLCCSSFYLSKALVAERADDDSGQQPDYVNAVARLRTTLAPHELLLQLQAIETLQGRVRDAATPRWSPRTLDLDILLYGERQIDTPTLTVPHVAIRLREFVLYPLYEISPDLEVPLLGPLKQLVKRCPRRGLKLLQQDNSGSYVERVS